MIKTIKYEKVIILIKNVKILTMIFTCYGVIFETSCSVSVNIQKKV